jgi:ABC-type lipoprotein export system ATPase subunit
LRGRHRYGDRQVGALDAWRAAVGEHWLVLGASGSGKTTLLGILGGLLRPSEGRVMVGGQDLTSLSGPALDRFRGREIDYVDLALNDLKKVAEELADIAAIEQAPIMEGRSVVMVLAPAKTKKK